jgi:hypothetical protein
MGKFWRTLRIENLTDDNAAAAYRRFSRSATDSEDRRMRQEITAAVIGLVVVLAVVGWALTL